ncbi:hypothetical protein MIND_01056100 [Mycena indigotica]|uniref:Phosphoglucomutase n=1 Tax=Mycena indigotica TaxID=2126181 RepID=A0A8H6VYQ9_9AGAR|nr:uncharacterized protein MIND_01056100 [Mycena indigotica]KAF7295173.1 hypothetical protein MIND_01056100 [Mycena indigotica]
MSTIELLAAEWLRLDQNPDTRAEIEELVREKNTKELERRLRTRIEFGTAGLRGRMAAGWACMNGLEYLFHLCLAKFDWVIDIIVIQASQGLCEYVRATIDQAPTRGIVIGHDHRHNSERWAKLTASVFINSGFKVYLHRGLVHTPLVPFSVQALNASCGVMITASHNPKDDNGYKVYWENAVQIIGPHDKGISAAIAVNLVPKTWLNDQLDSSSLCVDCTEDMKNQYFTNLFTLNLTKTLNQASKLKFVNTSLHGVSDAFVSRAFEIFGFHPYAPVHEQQRPDPDFPSVTFPNPEEKGALDLAIKTADTQQANYVLSQDPDSDRFCAAERRNGDWIIFTGDQLGTLFAAQALDRYKAENKPLSKLAMVASTVSSKMLEKMAQIEGFKFVECLTGFKFIGNTALNLVDQGYEVPMGYEEAIGFMFGSRIRDKDGVAATMAFAELAVLLESQGKTVSSYLQELYQTYGYFQTSNSYFVCRNPTIIDKIFKRLRNFETDTGRSYPPTIAGLKVTSVVDLTTGYDSTNPPSYEPSLPLSSGHMVQFRASANDTKIVLTIRTSGTEPKIKYYLEATGQETDTVHAVLKQVVNELASGWMEADKNQLGRP